MAATFTGFLTRAQYHRRIGTRPFVFDARNDIRSTASDQIVREQAHGLLRPFLRTHRYAVVALDRDWSGSPGADTLVSEIGENLQRNGWEVGRFVVIVIDPEIEHWLVQNSPHVAQAFRAEIPGSVREWLENEGLWQPGEPKCGNPKKAFEAFRRVKGLPRSAAIYQRIASTISVTHCNDPAFLTLRDQLRVWFPAEE